MTFGIFNPQTGGMQQQGMMQQPLVRAMMQAQQGQASPQALPVIPPLSTTPGVTAPPTPAPSTGGGGQFTNREMIQMMYGEPSGNGSDWDTFLGQTLNRRGYADRMLGTGIDDAWSRDSDFWQKFKRNADSANRRGGRLDQGEGSGGGGGGSGASESGSAAP